MAKKKNGFVNVRWKIKEDVHRRIAAYQKLHGIERMETAANIVLESGTEGIKHLKL